MNKKQYKELINQAYDDNHGITMQRKDYEETIKELEKKKTRTKTEQRKLEQAKKELEQFKPQWFLYSTIITVLNQTNTQLKEKQEQINRAFISGIVAGLLILISLLLILRVLGLI